MSSTFVYLINAINRFITALGSMLFYSYYSNTLPASVASFAQIIYRMLFFSIMMWVFKKVIRHG